MLKIWCKKCLFLTPGYSNLCNLQLTIKIKKPPNNSKNKTHNFYSFLNAYDLHLIEAWVQMESNIFCKWKKCEM